MKNLMFIDGDRVESLVEQVGEKGTVINCTNIWMHVKWDNLWRNTKISIAHDRHFTNDKGTEIFKLILK